MFNPSLAHGNVFLTRVMGTKNWGLSVKCKQTIVYWEFNIDIFRYETQDERRKLAGYWRNDSCRLSGRRY